MPEELTRALITIGFGALAGGLTNTVAIWMLFHPYEPPRLGGRSLPMLQGAIPKNKARLASRIGRTVGTRLLTDEDLAKPYSHYQPHEPPFNERPVVLWVIGNTSDHYDEHITWLTALLKEVRG